MLHRILLLSDGTGETAQRVLDAALVQFSRLPVLVERAPQLEEPDQLDRALEQAKRGEGPRELEGCDPRRVFALVMDCEVLARIRREPAHQPGFAGYADGQIVLEELELSRRLARQRGWCLVDTTGRALEEVADDVSASLAIRTRAAARSADRHPPRAA
ncbi:MAG: kinase/pyrophosphorylase [Deltaproteobacteria bacterium]|nr:kinase/pyrophosphorylase [Deltaproteobacteria bacterium]MBI3078057.1 kinase/pyrophosphorylase [Deltaproteobacteria bacterium]